MIQLYRPGIETNIYDIVSKQWYQEALAEQRQLPTEELQAVVRDYDQKSSLRKFLTRHFRSVDHYNKIKASRQVLAERVV